MKFARRADGNQPAIVAALRAAGAVVQPLHTVGQGVPDLLVAYTGANKVSRTMVIEIKDPTKPKSDRKLTPAQQKWHDMWIGEKHVVETVDEALAALNGENHAEVI